MILFNASYTDETLVRYGVRTRRDRHAKDTVDLIKNSKKELTTELRSSIITSLKHTIERDDTMANTPVAVKKGAVTFKSIRAAAEAAGVPYMTFYQRIRAGKTPSQAAHQKVRKYTKRAVVAASAVVFNDPFTFPVEG